MHRGARKGNTIMTVTTLRNASLPELVEVLQDQSAARYDVVAHSNNLRFEGGQLVITDQEDVVLTDEGVTVGETKLAGTQIFHAGIADRLDIPKKYYNRMQDQNVDLLDANVNGWLGASNKTWFVRSFKRPGETGVARAFLSDRFGCIDNFDVLVSALEGVRAAGVEAKVVSSNLSERRMTVKVVCPQVSVLAPILLANYRSPYGTGSSPERAKMYADFGIAPNGEPIVFAGFTISNGETGGSRFTITPELTVLACFNGMRFTADQLARTHLGSRMDAGIITWSDETNLKQVELVKSQTTDAVRQFCDPAYVQAKINEVEEAAGVEVTRPTDVIVKVCSELSFSDEEANAILSSFIMGGQMTAGGVMQAVTATAQTVLDPDRADDMVAAGIPALHIAARFASA